MEKIIIKALLLSLSPLFIVIVLLSLVINYIPFVDSTTISEYHKLSAEYLFQELTTEESRLALGMIITTFGEKELVLPTAFYEFSIINKKNLVLFLNNLDWLELILKNHFDIVSVKELVLTKYKDFILEEEHKYILETITKYSISDAKMDASIMLKDSLKSLHKNNSTAILNNKIMVLVENIHWETYMQTIDFQGKNFKVLKEFGLEQLSVCFDQNITNVISPEKPSSFCEKFFFANILDSFVIVLAIIWVLPQTLYYSFFGDYIRNIAINIAQQMVNDVMVRFPKNILFQTMTTQQIDDFFALLITMGIKEQGVLGVFLTLAKVRYFLQYADSENILS